MYLVTFPRWLWLMSLFGFVFTPQTISAFTDPFTNCYLELPFFFSPLPRPLFSVLLSSPDWWTSSTGGLQTLDPETWFSSVVKCATACLNCSFILKDRYQYQTLHAGFEVIHLPVYMDLTVLIEKTSCFLHILLFLVSCSGIFPLLLHDHYMEATKC